MEKMIMELTSRTPSGGTCWIGDIPFTVWYGLDYWEWEFQGVFYFDLLDLSEAIEAFRERTSEVISKAVSLSKKIRTWPKLVERKRITFPSRKGPSGLASGLQK